MKIMSGDAAVRASVSGARILDTIDGIILFPESETVPGPNTVPGSGASTGSGLVPGSGVGTASGLVPGPMTHSDLRLFPGRGSGRAVRYRPRYAGHLPEFWPADAAEACKMARSAMLYAETYRTPVLLRLPAEIRNSRISVIPKKRTMAERRSADYILERRRKEEKAGRGRISGVHGTSGSALPGSGTASSAPGTTAAAFGAMPDALGTMPAAFGAMPAAFGDAAAASGAASAASRMPLIPEEALSDSCWNPIYGHGGKGIIVRGPAYRKVIRILNGYSGVRVLKIGTAWPLPESQIRRFLQSVRTALVLDDTQEDLLIPVYAIKGKYELTGSIVPFEGMEDSMEDLAAAVIDLAGRDAVMDRLRMRA